MAIQTSYNKPDVTIIQQVVSPSVALAKPSLFPCIVGQAYRIITDSSAGSYDGTGAPLDYPSIVSTDTVDLDSVVVKAIKGDETSTLPVSDYTATLASVTLDDGITVERIVSDAVGSTGDSTASGAVFTDLNAKFITWGLEPSDKIEITSGSDTGTHIILTVDSETQITLTAGLTTTQSNLDYYGIIVDAIGGGLGSTIRISYRAARTDIDSVQTFESLEDASGILGVMDDPDNPLGFGVYMAMLNGNTQIKAIGVSADTPSAYVTALELLEAEDVYAIATLTHSFSVCSALKAHVDAMSAPAEKKERRGFCSALLSLRSVRLNSSDATVIADSGDIYIVSRPGAQFLTNVVANGDLLYAETVTEYQSAPAVGYTVREVTSEDSIKVESDTDITLLSPIALFSIASQDYTKLQQAQHIRDLASSIEDERVTLSWPDKIILSPQGTDQTVGGFYLNCAVASSVGALPAQQGFTRLRVSGVDNLLHSNLGYFTSTQLDAMASGGVMIFTQQTSGAIPEIRHQLTTNMSAIEYRELSIVKNVDFIAKFLRERLSVFIGTWNIHDFFMQSLKVTLQGAFEALKISDDISGPNITDATIVSIEQNEASPDRVDVIVDLGIPYPANDIRVTLRI